MVAAQYVFFRDPSGKAKRDGKYAPVHLLADWGESSFLQGGTIGYRRSFLQQPDALLASFVVLGPGEVELNDQDAKGIIWKALNEVATRSPGKPLNANAVLTAADDHAAAFFRTAPNKYILVASLSIESYPAKKIVISGCEITSLKRREPRYPLPKVLLSGGRQNHFADHLKSTRYQLVKVATTGRTITEGIGNALEGLNLLRAIWSFVATFKQWSMRFGSAQRKPIGVIHTGPIYTLHNTDGSVINEEHYWSDPDYTGDQSLFRDNGKWPGIEKTRRWASRKIASLPYRKELEMLFLRYISALDQANPNVAFLQLWGILEKITNTVGAKYDETIDRTCRVFSKIDRPVMKETLESLRHHRNRYVHAGGAGRENEQITYQIKRFVDPHILRLINNVFHVKSLQEYGEFLGYSTDIQTLEKMRNWSTRALRIARVDEEESAKAVSKPVQTAAVFTPPSAH
jgi:hypothetical protein